MQGYTLAYPVNPFWVISGNGKGARWRGRRPRGVAHWYIPRIRVLGRVGNARKASYKSGNARKARYKSLPKDSRDGTHAHLRYQGGRSLRKDGIEQDGSGAAKVLTDTISGLWVNSSTPEAFMYVAGLFCS